MATVRKGILNFPARAWILYHTSAAMQTKHSKADIIKKLYAEYGRLYGRLLEGKKEKLKRLELEEKGIICEKKNLDVDSEQIWVMNRTPSDRITIFTRKQNNVNSVEDKKDQTMETNMAEEFRTRDTNNTLVTSSDSGCSNTKKKNNKITTNITTRMGRNVREIPKLSMKEITKMKTVKVYDTPLKAIEEKPTKIIERAWFNKMHEKYPSVTAILQATMSEESRAALAQWRMNLIAQLGEKGFDQFQQMIFDTGNELHHVIQQKFKGTRYSVPQTCRLAYESLEDVLEEINDVRAVESKLSHSRLYYKGIVDCVATYRGKVCAIEWKQAHSRKDTMERTYDVPLQVAAYAGALNSSEDYPFKVEAGLIVYGYANGTPAIVYELDYHDLQEHWSSWLMRLQNFYLQDPSLY